VWKYVGICAPSHNFVRLRHISTIGEKLLNSNISSTNPHNMVNVGPADIGSGVWGTPANFNRFRVLASLLHRRRSVEVNQTLHGVWPSPGLVHYMYIFGGLPYNGILPGAKFTCVQVLCYPTLAALLHGARSVGVSQTLRRPSRWTFAVQLSSF